MCLKEYMFIVYRAQKDLYTRLLYGSCFDGTISFPLSCQGDELQKIVRVN